MRLEQTGLVFDAEQRPASERISFFTSLCALRSGRLLCGFQNGASKHGPNCTIRLCRSEDQGVHWNELAWSFPTSLDGIPGSLAAPEMVEPEPGRLLLFATWFDRSEPDRPLFDPLTEGILRSRQLLAVSPDEGETWSSWRVLSTADLKGCATTGPVLGWPDGTLAYAFESFKEFDDPQPGYHGAWLLISRDGGRAFEPPWLVAQDPAHQVYYWDQRLCPGSAEGEFLAMFWTHDLASQRDRNVHLLRGSVQRPAAAGEPPRETTLPGQIAAPLLLADGRLFAFVVDRERPGTLKLWLSEDGGHTWPVGLNIHNHEERSAISAYKQHVEFKQYWEEMGKWSFGHPAIRRLDEHHLLLAFYAGTPDRMSIHWARVQI